MRADQSLAWFKDLVDEELRRRFYEQPGRAAQMDLARQGLLAGRMTAVQAAQTLFDAAPTLVKAVVRRKQQRTN